MTRATFMHKLLHKRSACFGLFVIIFAIVIAIIGYVIVPDGSPNANRMIPEIANKKPGFSSLFVCEKVSQEQNEPSFFNKILHGAPDSYQLIPIVSYRKQNQRLIAQVYVDEDISKTEQFSLTNLAPTPVVKKTFYFGTDRFGRDILSRLILGTRVSLSVGAIAVFVSLILGIFLGALAGYFGGFTDQIIMWFINVLWSIPTLLLVFAITIVLGKGFWQIFLAVGLTLWVNIARLVRGQILAMKDMEFVQAGKVLGFGSFYIIFRQILPNIIGPIIVLAASNFASAIIIEAGLSFLGIGVQPPQPSWGLMIKENYNFIITNNPMLAIIPGLAIMILVLAFNLLGNGLRDILKER